VGPLHRVLGYSSVSSVLRSQRYGDRSWTLFWGPFLRRGEDFQRLCVPWEFMENSSSNYCFISLNCL
jgi:hypothetical protein